MAILKNLTQKTAVRTLYRSLLSKAVALPLLLAGCSSNPPVEEYTLARTAIESAKQYESDRYSPGTWFQAEENYRLGQQAYKEEDYGQAKALFNKARLFAEKSENKARTDKKRGAR